MSSGFLEERGPLNNVGPWIDCGYVAKCKEGLKLKTGGAFRAARLLVLRGSLLMKAGLTFTDVCVVAAIVFTPAAVIYINLMKIRSISICKRFEFNQFRARNKSWIGVDS